MEVEVGVGAAGVVDMAATVVDVADGEKIHMRAAHVERQRGCI